MKRPPDPRRKAVALRYDQERDEAPVLAAKGSGLVAERIVELARQHGVPIHDDPDLVRLLAQLELDAPIPPALYSAVAQVLAFVYRLNHRLGKRGERRP